MDNNLLASIKAVLEYRREHNSEGEKQFVTDYIMPHDPTLLMTGDENSEVAGYMLTVPNKDPNKKSKLLWSSHVDTMHRGKPDVLKQEIIVSDTGFASVTKDQDCLGADDGAGVWLMLEMYKAGVEGTYIFHRGEEKGCLGSKAIRKGHAEMLGTHTHAIAFDRKALTSVITFQRSVRCCSDEFGKQFAGFLGMGYALDDTGVYTDTAEYMTIIPECTNISTGYYSEHGPNETLDLQHLLKLREALTNAQAINAVDFVVARDPSKEERKVWTPSPSSYGAWGKTPTGSGLWADDYTPQFNKPKPKAKGKGKSKYVSRHAMNRGKTLAQRRNSAYLDYSEIPEIEDLNECTDIDIAEWIDLAGPESAATMMIILLDEIRELENQILFDSPKSRGY